MYTETTTPRDVTEFLAEARSRYTFGLDVDRIDRAAAEADNAFANASDDENELGQWEATTLARRKAAFRPALQWNRIPTYVQKVVNDGRQNKPAIKITAADGGQKETAEFFQMRIRQIEYDSDADIAYDTARDQQVTSGRGFIRVTTEWVPGTWKQRLRIERIENQFSVVFDPAAKKYDRSDAEWCFVIDRISEEEHGRRYGKDKIGSQEFAPYDNPAPGWFGVGNSGKLIQVAEYWCKEYKKRRLCLLTSQEMPVWKDSLTKEQYDTFKLNGQIVAERDEQHATIKAYVINGAEILCETEWIGSTIPIVPVWGREATVDGKRMTFSLIRNAKDPQRLVNLYVSNIAEQIAQMPKTPYLVPVGGIAANHEEDWKNATNTALAYLYYQAFDSQGRVIPMPSRVVNEPPIQALSVGLQQAIEGIKAAMGIFDSSLGAKSNETSALAIERRKAASEIVNFHFPDNEARSRKRIGEILVECIKLVDKPGSTATICSAEGKTSVVPVGTPYADPKTGEMVTHILTAGDYGVSIASGPSFDSARKEQREVMADLFKGLPDLFTILGDRWLATMDWVGSTEDAERMKRYIASKNPGLIQEEDGQKPLPPEVQAQMAQLQEELQATQGFAKQLHEKEQVGQVKMEAELKLKSMDVELQRELKTAELAFAREKLQADSDVKLAVAGIQADVVELKADLDRINRERAIGAAARLAEDSREHEATQSERDREHESELSERDRSHEAELSEADREAAEAPKEQE